MKKYKIIISGGHPSPAIATIDELSTQNLFDIVYVANSKAVTGEKKLSWEFQKIRELGVRFRDLNAGKFQRSLSFSTIISIIKIPLGFWSAFFILKDEKPNILLSFGGYIALPLVIWAKIKKIPVITHEQTLKIGLTNKIIGRLADSFCISWEMVRNQIKHPNIVLTGNPIRKDIFDSREISIKIDHSENIPLIYITGGGLGSHSINIYIKDIVKELLDHFIIIHQTGNLTRFNDYFNLNELRNSLPGHLKKRYYLFEHLEGKNVGWLLKNATFLVGRSGANTVCEILSCHIPALLIPLPWSGENEQEENAKLLKSLGVAEVLDQNKFKSEELLITILKLNKEINKYRNNFNAQTDKLVKKDAARRIVSEIKKQMIK